MANEIQQSDFQAKFQELVEGLYIMSETDAPLKPIDWKNIDCVDEDIIRKKAKQKADVPIEQWNIDDFFANRIIIQDWQSPEEKAAVVRLQQVVSSLKEDLTDTNVWKIGEAKKDVFIIGKKADGHYAGLKTYVVET